MTYSPANISDPNKGVRVLRSSNINEDQFAINSDDVFVNERCLNIDLVNEGDILITAANGSSRLVGKHAIITGLSGETVHGGFMLAASSDCPLFLNASMSAGWYRGFLNLHVAGGNGAIGNLNRDDLENERILVPCSAERKKIGTFFQQLDNLITLHQRQSGQYKKQSSRIAHC